MFVGILTVTSVASIPLPNFVPISNLPNEPVVDKPAFHSSTVLTAPAGFGGAVANQTRAVFRGGERNIGGSNATSNIIDFIQIATGGNAQDFGDATFNEFMNGMSDSHGGLGGY